MLWIDNQNPISGKILYLCKNMTFIDKATLVFLLSCVNKVCVCVYNLFEVI